MMQPMGSQRGGHDLVNEQKDMKEHDVKRT